MSTKPLCFVISPFGKKENVKKAGQQIDFRAIYESLIAPAIEMAGMEPVIESDEIKGGIIHSSMYEKIVLCDFCIADLSNHNANAFYELGMRYSVKASGTVPIMASAHFPLPFDVTPNRVFAYQVDADFKLTNLNEDIENLSKILMASKVTRNIDSPLYQLVNGISFENSLAHEKTDLFRSRVVYSEKVKEELKRARAIHDSDKAIKQEKQIEAIWKVATDNRPYDNIETGVLIDIMISFRAISAWKDMIDFIEQLPRYVFETTMVQEQYAFGLNRYANTLTPVDTVMIDKAGQVLDNLIKAKGPSSETYGIWGRIYKDKFDPLIAAQNYEDAGPLIEQALDKYLKGFEADPRDAYPGVNAVTCLGLLGREDEVKRLVPAVEFAVLSNIKRKETKGGGADYWDYATLVELAVIEDNSDVATKYCIKAKSIIRETWEPETTVKNLKKILQFREKQGKDVGVVQKIIGKLSI